jgi:purine-nucleoside phosphorylase
VSPSLVDATGRSDHRVAVILGSGLSSLAASLTGAEPIPYASVTGLPASGVPGHEGSLYSGEVEGTPALVFAGRVHLYEGRSPAEVVKAVEMSVYGGCSTVILTNAAGAIAEHLEIGAPCLVSDHLNLTGSNPLAGVSDSGRFVDMTEAYDPSLRALARAVDPELLEGVYAGLLGPSYETPAEVRMLARLGADLVGMSTVLETIAARRRGARVLGISVPTNRAAGLGSRPLDHTEVAEVGRRAADRLEGLLRGVMRDLADAAGDVPA